MNCEPLPHSETDLKRRLELVEAAKISGNQHLCILAAAMVDATHKTKASDLGIEIPCPQKELGYYLAEHGMGRYIENNPGLKTSDRSLWSKILQEFDMHQYIFDHTYYDECMSGYFFRRS